ncbi:lysophospholipid acyltransferase family protein [Fontimonas sp. SYSU GA230001]|uniref:lysophospholipid acyltransferase family protein n=1 Tax=Fontimonas sp. SYSU GA230001 TaxID=3142450 RepID=UPI0032B4ACC8
MSDRIAIGPSVPRRSNRFLRWLGGTILRLAGWRLDVRLPDHPRMVIIAAPHTSNWDFVYGMAAVLKLEVDLHWYGKHTLFASALGPLLRWLGGLPVDRGAPGGVVQQTAQAFKERAQLIIALAPEGTRAHRAQWKRGFYYMARAADVPVVSAYIDYARKEIGIGPVFTPTGDWDRDMKPVFDFYRGVTAKHPQNFAVEEIP